MSETPKPEKAKTASDLIAALESDTRQIVFVSREVCEQSLDAESMAAIMPPIPPLCSVNRALTLKLLKAQQAINQQAGHD